MKQPYLKENFETVYPRDKEEINLQDCIQVFFWIIKIIQKNHLISRLRQLYIIAILITSSHMVK